MGDGDSALVAVVHCSDPADVEAAERRMAESIEGQLRPWSYLAEVTDWEKLVKANKIKQCTLKDPEKLKRLLISRTASKDISV